MRYLSLLFFPFIFFANEPISLGADTFFEEGHIKKIEGKNIALVVNHTSINKRHETTLSKFLKASTNCQVKALFALEHGIDGKSYAGEQIEGGTYKNIPIHSLHGKTRRPTKESLKGIDAIIYDIQCTGIRAYTYPTSLFYLMEEAAKLGIQVIVLDRPNPIGGHIVDGPMLEESFRSFIGYINVPYCHGMTIGELARFFNQEYQVHCKLEVIPMKGWKRSMTYRDTKLTWVPPSPNVPEADTPMFLPMTGILGELQIVSIGIGYTLPFKVVGAPWIDSHFFSEKLNAQKLPGVFFQPYSFRPFSGSYKGLNCQGVLIQITDPKKIKPLAVQYLILGMLKSLYPSEFLKKASNCTKTTKDLFSKANGTSLVLDILLKEKYPAWTLIELHKKERTAFLEKRKKYLLPYEN